MAADQDPRSSANDNDGTGPPSSGPINDATSGPPAAVAAGISSAGGGSRRVNKQRRRWRQGSRTNLYVKWRPMNGGKKQCQKEWGKEV